MDVALIGAGLMGRPMAERLKAAGHQVHVYNRTREKVMDLENAGLHVTDHPDTAIRAASCVILMLADATVIGELLLTRFLLAFEVASFLLLIAAVGAVVLARRRRGLGTDEEPQLPPLGPPRPRQADTMAEGLGSAHRR